MKYTVNFCFPGISPIPPSFCVSFAATILSRTLWSGWLPGCSCASTLSEGCAKNVTPFSGSERALGASFAALEKSKYAPFAKSEALLVMNDAPRSAAPPSDT